MLSYYELSSYYERTKDFYDGYVFGSQRVYNPYAMTEFVRMALGNREKDVPVEFGCEWIKTSGNDILNLLLDKADSSDVADDIDVLENGKAITKAIVDQLTFDNMYDTIDGIWTVMLHTGYLTYEKNLGNNRFQLRIPNEEVLLSFDAIVSAISQRQAGNGRFLKQFCEAVESFDPLRIEDSMNALLENSVSLRDTATKEAKENYYHGIMNAALLYRDRWQTHSNPETGDGYCDIMVENENDDWGIVFELKYSKKANDFTSALKEGKRQILKCRYVQRLKNRRYSTVHMYAVAFHGRKCKVLEVFEKQ